MVGNGVKDSKKEGKAEFRSSKDPNVKSGRRKCRELLLDLPWELWQSLSMDAIAALLK